MNEILILALAAVTFLSFLVQLAQLVIAWYTLTEVGDLDKDKKDWWEHKSKRKSKKRR